MTEQERQALKVKTACCKDCGGWITQAAFPYCESSKNSNKDFREHMEAGNIIDVMTVGAAMLLPYCKCRQLREAAKKAAKTPDLFAPL